MIQVFANPSFSLLFANKSEKQEKCDKSIIEQNSSKKFSKLRNLYFQFLLRTCKTEIWNPTSINIYLQRSTITIDTIKLPSFSFHQNGTQIRSIWGPIFWKICLFSFFSKKLVHIFFSLLLLISFAKPQRSGFEGFVKKVFLGKHRSFQMLNDRFRY